MGIKVLEFVGSLFFGLLWIIGMVLAAGFWSTLFSIICPPWGWYLIVFTILTNWGII